MNEAIHRDPISAWDYLRRHGGLELDGRDEGFEDRILRRLDPSATSFKDALSAASMEAFASAFYAAVDPFVAMFRDILDFFKQAGATQGRDAWVLRVDGFDLDLEHFRQWIEAWSHVAHVTLEVKAVDSSAVWRLFEALRKAQVISDEIQKSFAHKHLNIQDDLRRWVSAYDAGEYLELPASLTGRNCPPELRSSALIAQAALLRLRDLGMNRGRIMALYRSKRQPLDPSDALDFWTLAQNETGFWLRTFVVGLGAAAALLGPAELAAVGAELEAVLAPYPLRPFDADVSISDLESVLSLPIWQKRHELYSVWIATEIVRALDGHDIELHHRDGCLEFAFRETLLATVHSSPGPFRLISEKRVALQNPRGKGRTAGVQPDHGLWTVSNGRDVCRMAIEVKHYKAAAKGKFIDVVVDYARALPEGEIYLVNHGPSGAALSEVSRDVLARCHSIDYLTASSPDRRQMLAQAVRTCVGEPARNWPRSISAAADMVLALDVSASMKALLRTPQAEAFIAALVSEERPRELASIDSAIRGLWPPTAPGFSALLESGNGSTDLGTSIHALLQDAERVLLITDQEGLSTLQGLTATVHHAQRRAPANLLVRVCTKAAVDPKSEFAL